MPGGNQSVAIIIPCLNEAEIIGRTLRTAMALDPAPMFADFRGRTFFAKVDRDLRAR